MDEVESNEFVINPLFEPLFDDYLEQPMYYNVYGGRGSGKSTAAAIAMIELTYSDYNHKILYLRQTMTSIEDSSITDIRDGIKSLGAQSDFKELKGKIINKTTGNFITFKGLRSNGSSKANLKSLSGFTTVVFEEAEDIESFEQFSKVDEGIRIKGIPLKMILVYNPTSALKSWIHKEWFIDGKPNKNRFHDTVFIHSTYHDNLENLNAKKVQRYEDLKRTDPVYYKNSILAEWTLDAQDRVYPDWRLFNHQLEERGDEWYALDWGYGGKDSTALVRLNYIDGKYYCKTMFEEPKLQIQDTLRKMKKAGVRYSDKIYCDHMPLLIEEIRLGGFTGARKCTKGKIEHGVKKVADKEILIVGGENDPLYYHHKTWQRTKGELKDHEPDALASLRYGIISHKPNKYPNGLKKKSHSRTMGRGFAGQSGNKFTGSSGKGFV